MIALGMSLPALATPPTVHEIQYQMDRWNQTIGERVESEGKAVDRWKWYVAHLEATLRLVEGNRAQFQDLLLRLDEMKFPNVIGSYVKTAELYSTMVELGVPVHRDKFERVLEVIEPEIGRIEGTERAAKPSYDDVKWLRIRGNLAFASGDIKLLSNLLEQSDAKGYERLAGYLEYLVFKLDRSYAQEEKVINRLEPIAVEAKEAGEGVDGSIALYLGEVYLSRAEREYGRGNQSLDKAVLYAREARRNIEILDSPAFWSLAMSLSVDVFDIQRQLSISDSKEARLFDLMSSRAKSLAIDYQ